MKIYSWNVNSYNTDQRAFSFIEGTAFDVLCLQEVAPALLAKIRELPLSIVYCTGYERDIKGRKVPYYSLIATPHAIQKTEIIAVGDLLKNPFRKKMLVAVLAPLGWTPLTQDHNFVYADIVVETKTYRVFSVHLPLSGPRVRLEEMERVIGACSSAAHNIVCGDLNIIEYSVLKPFNWLMGSSLAEANPFYSERDALNELCARTKLKNPLDKRRTHTIINTQFDHILIPDGARVASAKVHDSALGSDHYPVMVEVMNT